MESSAPDANENLRILRRVREVLGPEEIVDHPQGLSAWPGRPLAAVLIQDERGGVGVTPGARQGAERRS